MKSGSGNTQITFTIRRESFTGRRRNAIKSQNLFRHHRPLSDLKAWGNKSVPGDGGELLLGGKAFTPLSGPRFEWRVIPLQCQMKMEIRGGVYLGVGHHICVSERHLQPPLRSTF